MARMADAPFTAVDLSRLPAPTAIETLDFETLLADAVARYRAEMEASGLTYVARDSDPVTKLLQTFVYLAQIMRQRINDAVRAVMPAYAAGADLDNIAATYGIARLTITPADPVLGTPAVMESDAEFRRRMVLAPEGYSVAGPEGAYIFHALTADADVLDASAVSPRPGEVLISILSRTGNGGASPALVARVAERLNDDTIRPLTDHVIVQAAEIVEYVVEATLTTFSGPDADLVLAGARTRIEAYVAACHFLGRDPTRSGIIAALHAEGVQNVILTAPVEDIAVTRQQAPYCTAITITHAGLGE